MSGFDEAVEYPDTSLAVSTQMRRLVRNRCSARICYQPPSPTVYSWLFCRSVRWRLSRCYEKCDEVAREVEVDVTEDRFIMNLIRHRRSAK